MKPALLESCHQDPGSFPICLQNPIPEASGGWRAAVLFSLPPSQVQGQILVDTEKMVSIPQGSVLAYRVLQLLVEEDGWGKPIYPCSPPYPPLTS